MSDPSQSLLERIRTTLHYNLFKTDPPFPEHILPPFHSIGFAYTEEKDVTIHRTDAEEAAYIQAFCTTLYSLVDESPSVILKLDRGFSELLECHFHPYERSSPFWIEDSNEVKGLVTETASGDCVRASWIV